MGSSRPPEPTTYDAPAAPSFKRSVKQLGRGMSDYVNLERNFAPQLNQLNFDQLAQFAPQYNDLQNQMTQGQRGVDLQAMLEYGPAFKAAEEAANPEETAMRKLLGDQIMTDLKYGDKLDPYLDREITQGVRGGQAARGMTMGSAPVNAEGLARGSFANDLKTQRQGKAQSYLSMPQFDAFNAVLGRPSQASAGSSMNMFQNRGPGLNGQAMNNMGTMNNQWNAGNTMGMANNQMDNDRMYQDWQYDQQNSGMGMFSKIWSSMGPVGMAKSLGGF